jgi:hypothetical protein
MTVIGMLINLISVYIVIYQLKNQDPNNYFNSILLCLLININKEISNGKNNNLDQQEINKLLEEIIETNLDCNIDNK